MTFGRKKQEAQKRMKSARFLECLYFGPATMDVSDATPKQVARGLLYQGTMGKQPPRDASGRVKAGEWEHGDNRLSLWSDLGRLELDESSLRIVPFPGDYIAVYAIRTYKWEEKTP